jgi:hypothetical protein
MTKRILLLTAIALVGFVGFLAGQAVTERKVEIVKFRSPARRIPSVKLNQKKYGKY